MMASDNGRNARAPNFRSPSNSALEGPLPWGRLWRFPRIEIVDLVLPRIALSIKEAWFGCRLLLVLLFPWKPWVTEWSQFERVLVWGSFTPLYTDSSSGHRHWVPMAEDAQWAVFRLIKDA